MSDTIESIGHRETDAIRTSSDNLYSFRTAPSKFTLQPFVELLNFLSLAINKPFKLSCPRGNYGVRGKMSAIKKGGTQEKSNLKCLIKRWVKVGKRWQEHRGNKKELMSREWRGMGAEQFERPIVVN